MSEPERYVTLEELQQELAYQPAAFGMADDEGEPTDDWTALLERLLDEESERVEGDHYAGRTWGADEDVPGPVKHGIIRLARSRLTQIHGDGYESESSPAGQSATYTPAEDVRADVQSQVAKYRETDDESSGFLVV